MNLKGGVLIIGSLFWDPSELRHKWRKRAFKNYLEPVYTPMNIRYGRESKTRQKNYTMILSNHPSTRPGKAMILELKRPLKSFGALEKIAYELAEAEGIYVAPKKAKLVSKWGGSVGLWLNPKVDKTDAKIADEIRKKWAGIYSQYEYFKPAEYAITKKELPVISENGILEITSTKQMKDFDFLLATATKPNPQKQITARQIADRIIKTGNGEYFFKNREHNITTFQDKEVLKLLKTHGFKP
jgi:hypothetical protein